MFLDAALGKFDVILTWKLDRFCRNVKDFCDSIIYLQTHGVKFISMIDSIDLTTPMGEFISHIFAAIAQLESKNTSLRVKAMWDAKRARGESMARPGRRKHDYRAVAESYSRTQNMQATADEMGLTKGAVSKIVRIYKEERERPLTLVQ
jgi:DNA invertase Pin-like site-specific DNA recombinase